MRTIHKTIYLVSTVILLLLVFVVSAYSQGERNTIPVAASISELKFATSFSGGACEIQNVWHDTENGKYYAFIPGTASGFRAVNMPDNMNIADYEELFGLRLIQLSNIPCIFLTTESGSLEHLALDRENRESGSLSVINENGYTEYEGDLDSIHLRGNSSFFVEKKSFVLTFSDEQNLLGLGKSDKWYLLAQYQDDTKLRVQLANAYVSEYTDLKYTEFDYADVFVNGEYYGLYLIGRKQSAYTMGITDLEDSNTIVNKRYSNLVISPIISDDNAIHAYNLFEQPEDITGGYLLEIQPNLDEFELLYPAFRSSMGTQFSVKTPNNASYDEVEYIKNEIDELELALSSPDGINPITGKRYDEYIDVHDWVEYYLVKAGFMDVDVQGNFSVFLWKDSDNIDSLIHMGPVWDMDRAFGVELAYDWEYMINPNYYVPELIYADRMLEFPEVREEIRFVLENGYLDWCYGGATNSISQIYAYMHISHDADRIRWASYDEYNILTTDIGNVAMMTDYIRRRADFLKSYFVDGDVWHYIELYDNGLLVDRIPIKEGDTITEFPRRVSYTDYFVGWSCVSGDYSPEMQITGDMSFEAKWISADLLAKCDESAVLDIIRETDIIMLNMKELYGFRDALIEMREEF